MLGRGRRAHTSTNTHICDALADGLGHVGAQEHRPEELEDAGEHHCLLDRKSLGSHRGSESVRDIVSSDA